MPPDNEASPANPARHHARPVHFTSGELNMSHSNDADASRQALRLLIPVTAAENSRWGVRYALRLKEQGHQIGVFFLNVGEIITDWQALRFRTQAEMAGFQAERAQTFFEEASGLLPARNIPFRGLFRRGDPVFCIPDVAEELDCHQIVMPLPAEGISSFFSKNVAGAIMQKNTAVPIIFVDQDGLTADRDKKRAY
jgi:nucleotide-binding universal stress UspA family protein